MGTSSPEALLHVKAADTVTGTLRIEGGKETVTAVGEINSEIQFGSNDPSVGQDNIGGKISSVTEYNNGAWVGLAFYTYHQTASNLAERMRLTMDGRLGIGTTAPEAPLHVHGSVSDILAKFRDGSDGVHIATRGSSRQQIDFNGTNTSSINAKGSLFINYDSDNNGSNDTITFGRNRTDESGGSTDMVITEGKVGIGTTSPSAKLDIYAAPNTNSLYLRDSSDGEYTHNFWVDSAGNGHTYMYAEGNSLKNVFNTAGNSYFNGGNVGIGTTSPTYKLDVTGTGRFTDQLKIPLTPSATTDAASKGYVDTTRAEEVRFTRDGINNSSYTMLCTVVGDRLASIINMTITGTSNSVVLGSAFEIIVNHYQDIHVRSTSSDYTEATIRITSNDNEDYSIELKHNGSTTTQVEVCIFPQAGETITPTTTDPNYTGSEYEHTATEGWRYGGEDNNVESSNVIIDGKVGIGLTAPTRNLIVAGTAVTNGIGVGTPTSQNGLELTTNGTNYEGFVLGHSYLAFGTNHLNVGTTASERMRITSGGLVGIGTASPDTLLHLEGAEPTLRIFDSANTLNQESTIQFGTEPGNRTQAEISSINLNAGNAAGGLIFRTNEGSSLEERMRIDNNGNVGIGTTSPNALLHVSHATAPTFRLSRTGTGQIWHQAIDSSGRFLINEAASEGGTQYTRLAIDDDGNVGIGVAAPTSILDVNGGSANGFKIQAANAATEYALHATTSDGTSRLWVGGTGNVGIATTTPATKLQIDQYTVGSNGTQDAIGTASIFTNSGSDGLYLGVKNASYPNRGYALKVTNNGVNSDFTIKEHGLTGERFTIQTGGNVGIGTTSPANRLSVTGSSTLQACVAKITRMQASASNDTYTFEVDSSAHTSNMTAGGAFGVKINSGKAFKIDGQGVIHQNYINYTDEGNYEALKIFSQSDHIRIQTKSVGSFATENRALKFYIGESLRGEINNVGYTSYGNVYVSGTSAFRNYGNIWTASTGGGHHDMRFLPNDTERLRIVSSTGNVGIGTASPTAPLHVKGQVRIERANATVYGTIDTMGNYRFGAPSGYHFTFHNVQPDAGGEIVRIKSTGEVGIGTASPATIFHAKDASVDNGLVKLRVEGGSASGYGELGVQSGYVRLLSNGTLTLAQSPSATYIYTGAKTHALNASEIRSAGNFTAENGTTATKLELYETWADASNYERSFLRHASSFLEIGTEGLGSGVSTISGIKLRTAGSSKLTILAGGNVGIGTDSPATKLDVSDVITSKGFRTDTSNANYNLISRDNDLDALYVQNARSNTNQPIASFRYGSASAGQGTEVFKVGKDKSYFSACDVGIGTTSPAAPLDVTGSINLSGELNFSGNGNKNLDVYTLADSNTFTIRHHNPSGNLFETAASFTANGGASLHYNNGVRLSTTTDGISLSGNGYLDMPDNGRIRMGEHFDFAIYHDGGNNWLTSANGRNLMIQSNGLALRSEAQEPYINCTANGAVDIYHNGTTSLATVVGGIKVNSTMLQRSSLVTFANSTANQKVDLYWTGTQVFWGEILVTVTGTYSNQNNAGSITKKFYVGLNASNSVYTNESRYTDTGGVTADNFAISDLRWDSTNSRYYITVVHRVSTGNQIGIKVEAFAKDHAHISNIDDITTGSVYTTDTTAYDKPYVQYNDDVNFKDNAEIKLGTGTDFKIYHKSSNNISFIENTNAAGLRLLSDEIKVFALNGTAIRAHFGTDVRLYYNDAKKFETTSTGATVTGRLSASEVAITNIVTNKIVKFNGTLLDDSSISDDGSTVTVGADLTVTGGVVSQIPINAETASYTLVLGDQGGLVEVTSSSDTNVTIPPQSSVAYETGTQIIVQRQGTGAVTIVAGSGVTAQSANNQLKIRARYGACVLIKKASDTWAVIGDMDS